MTFPEFMFLFQSASSASVVNGTKVIWAILLKFVESSAVVENVV